MGPLKFGDHKFIGGQTTKIHDNFEPTCLFRSSVGRSSL